MDLVKVRLVRCHQKRRKQEDDQQKAQLDHRLFRRKHRGQDQRQPPPHVHHSAPVVPDPEQPVQRPVPDKRLFAHQRVRDADDRHQNVEGEPEDKDKEDHHPHRRHVPPLGIKTHNPRVGCHHQLGRPLHRPAGKEHKTGSRNGNVQ